MDLYYKQNPAPSKEITQRGNVVDGSYFLADGELYFADESISCEFEVANMEDGISWAIVYIQLPEDGISFRERSKLESRIRQAKEVKGIDRLWKSDLKVFLYELVSAKGFVIGLGFRFIYTVQRFEVSTQNTPGRYINFLIANLPLDESYSPQRNWEETSEQYFRDAQEKGLKLDFVHI